VFAGTAIRHMYHRSGRCRFVGQPFLSRTTIAAFLTKCQSIVELTEMLHETEDPADRCAHDDSAPFAHACGVSPEFCCLTSFGSRLKLKKRIEAIKAAGSSGLRRRTSADEEDDDAID
jgi:hypothetical protein